MIRARFSPLMLLCILFGGVFFVTAALAQDLHVRTSAELQAALTAAQGGTITLADGQYDLIEISRKFPAPVVVQGASRQGVVIAGIQLEGVTNLALRQFTLQGSLSIKGNAADIAVEGLMIEGSIYCRDVARIVIHDNDIRATKFGLILNSVQEFTVTHNRIRFASEDLMRITTRSSAGLVAYNIISDTQAVRPMHPDLLQIFGYGGNTPHDIVIQRNLLTDPPARGDVIAQGIFVSDPRSAAGYRNILIAENLISVSSPNSIYVWGGEENVVIRNNTLIPAAGDGGAIIRLAKRNDLTNAGTWVIGNVAKLLRDETKGSQIGENYFFGRNARMASLFEGRGAALQWQDFAPRYNTPPARDGMGAIDFLQDLAAGRVYLGPSWVTD